MLGCWYRVSDCLAGRPTVKINLPDERGRSTSFTLKAQPIEPVRLGPDSARVVYAAAHVVADPFAPAGPGEPPAIDWDATLAFRRHLDGLGLGIAEAMDTAQRGMGLGWTEALELIRRTRAELPEARVFNGVGTDQLDANDARSLDDVRAAYFEQLDAVQSLDARVIVMASRALARLARSPDDYASLYADVLDACDRPVILHWLGAMFDPALQGYWGHDAFDACLDTVVSIIEANVQNVDGIKISLLDADKEIRLRRRLPTSVKMYTGDDFNYPSLIQGDELGFSHALLGIFDPIAPAAAHALAHLSAGDVAAYRATLDPTVPLARQVFRSPTQFYKTGVVFLAWLNGHQDHFVMVGGAQASRPLPDFVALFRQADACGLLRDPELAISRMRQLLSTYGAG